MITTDRNDAKRHQTDSTTTNRVCIILYVNSVLVVIWQKSDFCSQVEWQNRQEKLKFPLEICVKSADFCDLSNN